MFSFFSNPSFPWYIARASGITAYILMFLVVIIGTGLTSRYTYKIFNPVKAWVIHKYLSLALGVAVITHIVSLLFDKFISLGFLEVLIPFYASYRPVLLSLGIFAFYLLILIVVSSLLFRIRYARSWRFIHYFTYTLFILSFVHGVLIGTDSRNPVMQGVYWFTGILFFISAVYRFLLSRRKNN